MNWSKGNISTNQNVIADRNNSSTTNLDATNSYTFTGTGTSTLGVNGLQWSLITDQNATVYIEQSPDNVNWDISYAFDYIALYGGQGETVQATQSYWRIRVVLAVTTATTYFRLSGILCPVAVPLPSSLTQEGRLKTETHISSSQNRDAWVSPRDELIDSRHVRLVGKNFDGSTKDPNFWEETVANGGTVVQGGGSVTLNTGTTANGSAIYQTTQRARFVAGTSQLFIGRTTTTKDVIPGNVRRIGPYDSDDGFFFQAGTVFGIGTRIGGVGTIINDGSFNGEYGTNFPTNINVYFSIIIEWTPTTAYWYIDGKLLHSIEGELLVNTNSLPITIENVNSGGLDTQVDFTCVEAAIMRQGELETVGNVYHISGNAATHVIKIGSGKFQRITFNNTSGNSITIYDGVDATGIERAVITTGLSVLGSWEFNMPFSEGLTMVTLGNSLDATVMVE